MEGLPMGFTDDAKDTVDAAAKRVDRAVEDAQVHVSDKADEVTAAAKAKAAEAELAAVKAKNKAAEDLRKS
jgi:hypothetical protein